MSSWVTTISLCAYVVSFWGLERMGNEFDGSQPSWCFSGLHSAD